MMSSPYVISKDLIIPIPFEDYLKLLVPYTVPNLYHLKPKHYQDHSGFKITIWHENNETHVGASQKFRFAKGGEIYVYGLITLNGIISNTSDNQVLIGYTLDAQDLRKGIASRDAFESGWGFLTLIFLGSLLLGVIQRFNLTFVGLLIAVSYFFFAWRLNKHPEPAGIKETQQFMTDFESTFIQVMTTQILDIQSSNEEPAK